MATVLSCDRCGNIYNIPTWKTNEERKCTSINIGFRTTSDPTNYRNGYDTFDLCPDCMKQLKRFLSMESEDEHGEDKDGGH